MARRTPVDIWNFPQNPAGTYTPPNGQTGISGPPIPAEQPVSRPAAPILPITQAPGAPNSPNYPVNNPTPQPASVPPPDPATVPPPDSATIPPYTIPVSLTPAPAPTPTLAPPSDATPTASIPAITVTGQRPTSRTQTSPARTADGNPTVVSRADDPPTANPEAALQTAKAINSELRPSYDFAAEIFVNKVSLGAPFSLEVSKNNNRQSDRYYIEMELSALPENYQEAYWSSGDQKQIEVRCGFKDGKLKSLIIGLVDDCEIDWLTRSLTLRGRDLTSLFIDNKTAEKFANKTSSQVVELLAARRGLSSVVTKTTTLVGEYYQREHSQLNAEMSEHDVISWLAEQEGFDYWLEGTTLHFEQPKPVTQQPFVVNYKPPTAKSIASGTFTALKTKRSETLAKDVIVTVIAFNPKSGKAIKATATRSRIKTSNSKLTKNTRGEHVLVQPYVFRIPGLNKEQAQATANKLAETITKNERNVTVDVPFDPVVDCRCRLSLRGTKTEYDQPYFIESIEYSASYEAGSRMQITAKNCSPQTTVTT